MVFEPCVLFPRGRLGKNKTYGSTFQLINNLQLSYYHHLKVKELTSTSRERPKSAPYLMLKNSKNNKGSKYSLPQHPKNFSVKSLAMAKKLKGGHLVSSVIVCYAGNIFGSVPWANRYNLASP